MRKKVLLISVPAPEVEQTEIEKEYWKWYFALKTKLTYTNLSNEQLMNMGNVENQNVGLLSIASYLNDNDIEVAYLAPSLEYIGDNRIENFLSTLLNKVREFQPDFVGFSAFTCSIPIAINYCREIKKNRTNY